MERGRLVKEIKYRADIKGNREERGKPKKR